jgi:uncharacterized protein YoxC
VSDHVEEAEEALENFSKGLSDAHTDLAEHRSAWLKAVDDLTTEVIDSTKASFDGMVELLKAQGTALLGLGNSLVDSHNRNLEPVDRMFSEEAVQSVTDVVDPLVQELTNVTQQAASRKDQFSEKAQTILNSLEALIPEIENLTIQLRTTQGL